MDHPNGLAAAAARGIEALEAAWLEHLDKPREARWFFEALDALPEPHRRGAAPSLLLLLLEAYVASASHADVLSVIKQLQPFQVASKKNDLRKLAKDALAALHGNEEWYALFVRLAELDGPDLLASLDRFDKLAALRPGSAVYHRTGWGEGLVTGLDLAQRSIKVRFRSESLERSMPFTTGLDVLTVLSAEDLRGRLLTDVEGLKRDAEERPSRLLRAVARLHNGRASAKEIKQWLCGPVIEPSAWAGWWRKAKVAASQDPYIAVDNPARPVFVLRKRALSAQEEVQEAMTRCKGLAALLDVVRGPLSLDPADDVKSAMLDALNARIDLPGEDATARAEAALMLARYGRISREDAGRRLHAMSRDALGFPGLVARMNSAPLRREAFEAYVAAEPQLWSDGVISQLPVLPLHILDLVAERLVADGRGEALANRLHIFLLSPSKQPGTVLRLARRFTAGLFEGVQGAPSLVEVFMGLLHLAETQAFPALRGKKDARDALDGVLELFMQKKHGLLPDFASVATRVEMTRAMGVLARCKALPDNLVGALGAACRERFPDLVPRDDTPFWDSNNIFCSRNGLQRRQEEYRVLIEVKIPENSETIGRAASYGDLSENFEWTAAIEQQRQLTEKAAAMEAELKLARAIEDQELTEGMVSPGTRVTYVEAGETKVIRILGPWDDGADVVSYRAPVAAGMLGARAGDRATLELPSGRVEVEIRAVERVL